MIEQKLHSQDENKIDVLEFPANIRSVAGMYIGSGNDCTNILREAVDNAMDELSFVPEFNTILVDSGEEGKWFMVSDRGRGMPIYMHPQYEGWTAARVATSKINAGGKFSKSQVASGQNGVGIKCTNALSELFLMFVRITSENIKTTLPELIDQGKNYLTEGIECFYCIEYHKGEYIKEYIFDHNEVGSKYSIVLPKGSSTVVYFKPDYSLIKNHTYQMPIYNIRYKAFQMKEYLHKDIHILVNGEDVVSELPQYKWHVKHRFNKLVKAKQNEVIDLYFSFEISNDLRSKTYKGSVNSLVVNDGLHVKMAVTAIRRAICNLTGCENTYKLEQGLKVRSILNAIKVDFKSQTKEYCNVIDGWDDKLIEELVPKVEEIFKKNLKFIKDYVSRIKELDSSYKKIELKRYVESKIHKAGSSKKLRSAPKTLHEAGANTKNRDQCELFIVEGKSAAGTLVDARDPMIHAVLGLRGRPLNTVMRNIKEVVKNEEMRSLINVIGMGVNISPDVKNKRYGKIIIAADADSDGGLITSSVLATIAVHMTFLLNLGMVYVAESPLYEQGGKYIYPSDDENLLDRKKPFTRFKGLGEINPDQAYDIFFNPKKRRLIKVIPDGSRKAIRFLEKSAELRRITAQELGVLQGRFDQIDNKDE